MPLNTGSMSPSIASPASTLGRSAGNRRKKGGKSINKYLEKSEAAGSVDLVVLERKLKKDIKANAKGFWEALKSLIAQNQSNTEAAFRKFSNPGDGMMSVEQFKVMCETFGMQLAPPILRTLFESRLQSGEECISLRDFQDALTVAQIDRIRARIQGYNKTLLNTAGHIDSFIAHLALHTGEENRRRAVARFQRKLTLGCCMDCFKSLQAWGTKRHGSMLDEKTEVDCHSFLKIADDKIQLQGYELDFLAAFFRVIDRRGRGTVIMADLAVALVLISTGATRMEKARFLFYVFDMDSDGCLTTEQLLRMYCSCSLHGALARGDGQFYKADITLGDELSLAKARRLYEYTLAFLQQILDDDLCTFEEWWSTLQGNDRMLEEIVPGTHTIYWLLFESKTQVGSSGEKAKPGVSISASPPETINPSQALASKSDSKVPKVDTSPGAGRRQKGGHTGNNQKNVALAIDKRLPSPRRPADSEGEKFRVQTAIRFRHAVRGEWDAINALDSGPPPTSAEHGAKTDNAVATRLPYIKPADREKQERRERQRLVAEQERQTRAALWAEEVGAYGRRHRHGNWHDTHRDTISDWSTAPKARQMAHRQAQGRRGRSPSSTAKGGLGTSQSLPSLFGRKGERHRPTSGGGKLRKKSRSRSRSPETGVMFQEIPTIEQIVSQNTERVANLNAEVSSVLDSMPMDSQHVSASMVLDRLRKFSEARASRSDDDDNGLFT
eukprot:TRINITY_DN2276_c1_g2_i1.p1 TRINITY_DN2276_c1_g2~~TRINITY_DN2276_c1_g2_i1.p1  ORF type:complete len:725 (-),score=111.89 TRINITY_DN2276_c1_g2_i1:246-2420(-)